jgi:hypothetical protein
MAKHDTDGNKILEGDELTNLKSSRDSDLDGDGKITTDELVQNSLKKSQPASTTTASALSTTTKSATTAAGDTALSKSGERKLVNDTRKSYRFRSTKDRLTSWSLAGRDKNGDGQVSMSEYSRSWSDRTAAEFQRYDSDGDGMITSEEKH